MPMLRLRSSVDSVPVSILYEGTVKFEVEVDVIGPMDTSQLPGTDVAEMLAVTAEFMGYKVVTK